MTERAGSDTDAMTSARPPRATRATCRWLLALALGSALGATSQAQVLGNPGWSDLSPKEQQALQPLKDQWGTIDSVRKQKWRDIAERFPTMTPDQQARTTSRMAEWAAMSPAQRNAARLQFEQVRQMPASERQARWDAYQSLPSEQRDALILVGAEGFSYEDAALMCGCAVGTLKSRVNRAREKLRETLGLAAEELPTST